MVSVLRKTSRSEKSSTGHYHLAAGNSLLKEGWASMRLKQGEAEFYAAADTKVGIASARNGHEAFQVFIVSSKKRLKDVTVEMTPLVNSRTARKIPSRHVGVFLVESVKTKGKKPDKYWPDILHPCPEKFDVPGGQIQPLWVSIHVPKGTPAGDYHGQMEIRPAGAPIRTVQVKLRVWDFVLPEKTHIATVFGFTTMDSMSRFYDFYPGSPQEQSAMVRKYLRFLNDRRINTLFYGYTTVRDPRIVSIKEGKNGKLSYDFTKLDPLLRTLVEMGVRFNIFAPAFWQTSDQLFKLNPLLEERFGHLGDKLYDSPEFDKAVAELLDSYVKHLRRKGWLKNALCYVWDEPPARMYGHMRKMCELVKKIAPDVPRMTVANYEPFELEGLSDIWCPNLGSGDSVGCYDKYKDFYERRKRAGDEVWWYLACAPHPYPNWFLDYPLVDCRITGWLTWRYGLDGLGYWNTNAWHYGSPGSPHGDNFRTDPAKRWPNGPWDPSWTCSAGNVESGCTAAPCQGNGQLVYPGPDGPLSSIRMETIRDGIEDYEYLRLLERKSATLAKKRSTPARQKLLRASQRILSAVRRAANTAIDWEQDGGKLLALRSRIGLQIEAVTAALRK